MTTATADTISPEATKRAALALEAVNLDLRDALLVHARMGRSVPQGDGNGGIRWITPVEIFARYGLDENGKPKG